MSLLPNGVLGRAERPNLIETAAKRWIISNASGYIAGLHRAMEYMMALGATLPNQAIGSTLCADAAFYGELPNRGESRDRTTSSTGPTVIFVARLIPWKRTHDVIRAFSRSQARVAGRLILVGDGPELEPSRDLAGSLGLVNCGFLPFQQPPELRELYRQADVLVLWYCAPTKSRGVSWYRRPCAAAPRLLQPTPRVQQSN